MLLLVRALHDADPDRGRPRRRGEERGVRVAVDAGAEPVRGVSRPLAERRVAVVQAPSRPGRRGRPGAAGGFSGRSRRSHMGMKSPMPMQNSRNQRAAAVRSGPGSSRRAARLIRHRRAYQTFPPVVSRVVGAVVVFVMLACRSNSTSVSTISVDVRSPRSSSGRCIARSPRRRTPTRRLTRGAAPGWAADLRRRSHRCPGGAADQGLDAGDDLAIVLEWWKNLRPGRLDDQAPNRPCFCR